MANLRRLKKDIDYVLEEVVFDCDMAIIYQPSKEQEIFQIMQQAVALRNELFEKANNPFGKKPREAADKHGKLPRKCGDNCNSLLVKRQYAALRKEIAARFEELFVKLSELHK